MDYTANAKAKRTESLADRYALFSQIGLDTKASRIAGRLENRGVDVEAQDFSGSPQDALERIAHRGAKGGKRAERFRAMLTKEEDIRDLEEMEGALLAEGRDRVTAGTQALYERFRGLMGPGASMTSPATQAALAQFQREASLGLSASDRAIKLNTMNQIMALRDKVDLGMVADSLAESGAIMEMLARMKEQEDALADAQRGEVYAGMSNPFRAIGSGVGGWAGGREGAVTGGPMGQKTFVENYENFMRIMSVVSMFGGGGGMGGMMGGGGGGGGGPSFGPVGG